MKALQLNDLYEGFRNPQVIHALAQQIQKAAARLETPLYVMEVCGGHTHTIMKYGLSQLMPPNIHFIHGPGCPVCIMPKERIDHAITLAQMEDTILLTLGDMIRVPGSKGSLGEARASGYDIRPLYTPLDALKIAEENPQKQVIFFAIGFETTTPMTVALLDQVIQREIDNLYLHVNHVLVPPAVEAIMEDGRAKVNAFIGPSHVSVITGSKIYDALAEAYATPIVISGFEPVDVMEGILMLVQQKLEGRAVVEVQYSRAVTSEGNPKAQALMEQYLCLREHFRWRGLGDIPQSALGLRDAYAKYDAEKVFGAYLSDLPIDDHKRCICGHILKGLATPKACQVFGTACTPQSPLGSCMVSSEGACHAYYRFSGIA